MKYAIGITSYKDTTSKDKTPAQVVETIERELAPTFNGKVIILEAWGVYKGQKEPSAWLNYIGNLQPTHIVAIKKFLRKYNQESALLIKYLGNTTAISIPAEDIDEIQKQVLEFTHGKFGEFMSYLPESKQAIIFCVEDFGMDCKEFQKQALLVAHKFGGHIFHTTNQVIT
jgi:hypothetical protein